MKKIKHIALSLSLILAMTSCEQEMINLSPPDQTGPACPDNASAGSADFSKFIAIGNSFVAGVQGGALFTTGQNNSLPAILNKQFECVGGPATFNQPSINASLGFNLFITQPFLTDQTKPILGRMLLQYGDNVSCATGQPSPAPTPQAYAPGELEALPNPVANPGFMYTGSKTELNNFAVPAITVGQLLTPATGNWGDPDPTKGFSPFYGRFASAPGTSRIITDAASAGGTFFLFWAGLDDFLLYAAFGGDPTKAPLTTVTDFQTRIGGALSPASPVGLLGLNPEIKGVIGNFPDIFKMPHFTLVAYNPIPLDETTVTALSNGFAGYNGVLDGLVANKAAFGISDDLADEIASRKVSFTAGCNNKVMLIDETLADLGGYFDQMKALGFINDAQRAGLVPYEQIRQSTPEDVIPLSAGSVLGENGTFGVLGVSEPLSDQYVIIPTEKAEIEAHRTMYNQVVAGLSQAFPDRLALADVAAKMNGFTSGTVVDGVLITPDLVPPSGIYSEDGLHFNSRGYAFIADAFIDAINSTYDATVPSVNLGLYGSTGLPIP